MQVISINLSHVQIMSNMFDGANSFNQDISGWDFTSLVVDTVVLFTTTIILYPLESFVSDSDLSVYRYDKLLMSLADQLSFPDLSFGGTGLIYCEGAAARESLINNLNWTFDDSQDQGGTNEFTSTSGPWTNDDNWSLMRVPSFCNDVIIDGVTSGDAFIDNDQIGQGATLDIKTGSTLKVDLGGELEIRSIP